MKGRKLVQGKGEKTGGENCYQEKSSEYKGGQWTTREQMKQRRSAQKEEMKEGKKGRKGKMKEEKKGEKKERATKGGDEGTKEGSQGQGEDGKTDGRRSGMLMIKEARTKGK